MGRYTDAQEKDATLHAFHDREDADHAASCGGCGRRLNGDLDMDAGWLLLSADTAKTGIGQYCRLPEEPLSLIERLGKTSCMIWPQPYNRRWLWQSMRRIVKRAGLPDDRRYRFHAIRRTAATLAVANGSLEQARILLGHTSQRMTARYIDPRIVMQRAPVLPRVVG